jgi:integrase
MPARRGKNEGSIYQRKSDGRWVASVDLGVVNGKRKRKPVYGKTRKEVAEKLKKLHSDQQRGINIAPELQTVRQFLEEWLERYVRRQKRARTYQKYCGDIEEHIIPALGKILTAKLTTDQIQDMINDLADQGLSHNSMRNVHAVLRQALDTLVPETIPRNPAIGVDIPQTPAYKPTFLVLEQARYLLEAVRGHRLEVLYRLLLSLGFRRGEALAIRKIDINWSKAEIAVTGVLQRIDGKLARTPPKPGASATTAPVPVMLLSALRRHLERMAEEGWGSAELVFVSDVGTPLEPRNLNRHFKALVKKANDLIAAANKDRAEPIPLIPETIRIHDLRHSCATFLIAQGAHPRVIMETLRHAQISTTMNIYGHVIEDVQREAVEGLGALFDDPAVLELPPRRVERDEK